MTILEKFSTFSVFLLSALYFQLDLKHQDSKALFTFSPPSKEGGRVEKAVNRKKGQPFFLKVSLPDGNLADSFLPGLFELTQRPEVCLMFEPLGKEIQPILLSSRESPSKLQDSSHFTQRLGDLYGVAGGEVEALKPLLLNLENLAGASLEALEEEGTLDDGEMGADIDEEPILEQMFPKPPVEEAETLKEATVLALVDPELAKKTIASLPAELEEMEVVVDPKPPAAKLEEGEIMRFADPAKEALAFLKPSVEAAEVLQKANAPALVDVDAPAELDKIEVAADPAKEALVFLKPPVKTAETLKEACAFVPEALVAVPVEEPPLLREACPKGAEPEHKIAAFEKPKDSIFKKVSKLLAERKACPKGAEPEPKMAASEKPKKHDIFEEVSTVVEKLDPRRFWGLSGKPDGSNFSYYGDRSLRPIRFGSKPGV